MKPLALLALCCAAPSACAQHLLWHAPKSDKPYTAIYGEIEVVATNKTVYYCGCNWWPGNPAGGYTGIQDPGGGRHNMIFSIWDTSPTLHPSVVQADKATQFNRFGGEGTGAHTHLDYHWEVGKTYRYYATKTQDATGGYTFTRLYFFDGAHKAWVHEATIANPNNGKVSVTSFGGMLNAFLENWSGQEREKPKLALYRLWVGTNPHDLVNVTEATGDGKWGVFNDTFYLAEGDDEALGPAFAAVRGEGRAVRGDPKRKDVIRVSARTLPAALVEQLDNLPVAPDVPRSK